MDLLSLFQQRGIPDLSQVQSLPGMDMGPVRTSTIGMTNTSDYMPIDQGIDYMKLLGLADRYLGDSQQRPQQATPMPPAPIPQLQAGGGLFTSPYADAQQQFQFRPTSQALAGLY